MIHLHQEEYLHEIMKDGTKYIIIWQFFVSSSSDSTIPVEICAAMTLLMTQASSTKGRRAMPN